MMERRLFNFHDCWIGDITPPAYSDSSDPLVAEATINFLTMEDWASGITGDQSGHANKINDYSGVKSYS